MALSFESAKISFRKAFSHRHFKQAAGTAFISIGNCDATPILERDRTPIKARRQSHITVQESVGAPSFTPFVKGGWASARAKTWGKNRNGDRTFEFRKDANLNPHP
jgi:hypothetical protein